MILLYYPPAGHMEMCDEEIIFQLLLSAIFSQVALTCVIVGRLFIY
jgi:hypothetical protein